MNAGADREASDVYTVEAILGERRVNKKGRVLQSSSTSSGGRRQFLIHWKGYRQSEANLATCDGSPISVLPVLKCSSCRVSQENESNILDQSLISAYEQASQSKELTAEQSAATLASGQGSAAMAVGSAPQSSCSRAQPCMWLACDSCGKWRRIGCVSESSAPAHWTCAANPDSTYNSCDAPQELSNDDIDRELGLLQRHPVAATAGATAVATAVATTAARSIVSSSGRKTR